MTDKGEENRARILAAAEGLIYRKGFNRTSFADIATETGIPKGNFYFYFPTKDALLAGVVERRLGRLTNALAEVEASVADPKERLRRMVPAVAGDFEEMTRYGCPLGSLSAELGKQQPDLGRMVVAMFKALLDWATRQYALIVGEEQATRHARDHLVRLQGAALLAATFQDDTWFTETAAAIDRRLDAL